MNRENYTWIGKITSTFGIKGELKVKCESDFSETIFPKITFAFYF